MLFGVLELITTKQKRGLSMTARMTLSGSGYRGAFVGI